MKMLKLERKDFILQGAIEVAEKMGYKNFTSKQLGEHLQISGSLIRSIFRMDDLRLLVMKSAIKSKNLIIIAQGLILRDKLAIKISPDLKRKALKAFS